MNGIFAMYYTGLVGSGHVVVIKEGGKIAGADATGGLLDGTYEEAGEGFIDVVVELIAQPGTWLVTGPVVGQEPIKQQITARLPDNLGAGHPLPVQTPTGPVNVIFKRLRDAI
jgi:hypothetical protein